MSYLSAFDSGIQAIRGGIADSWGEMYDVRRLDAKTNGSVSNNVPVLTNFPVKTRRITQKVVIESEAFSLNVYSATCDNTLLQIGDVLTQTGYKSDGRIYTYAQQRPGMETLFMRTEISCFISRPHPGAGNPEQQPASGWSSIPAQGAISRLTEQVLVLQNGEYSFEDEGAQQASIYVGMSQLNRIRDGKDLGTPTDLPDEHFLFYLPFIATEAIERKDRINIGNSTGDRYEILSIASSESVGLTGSIVIAGMIGT